VVTRRQPRFLNDSSFRATYINGGDESHHQNGGGAADAARIWSTWESSKSASYKPGCNHASIPSRHHGSIWSMTVVTKQSSPAGDDIKAYLGAHEKARKNYGLNRDQRRVTT